MTTHLSFFVLATRVSSQKVIKKKLYKFLAKFVKDGFMHLVRKLLTLKEMNSIVVAARRIIFTKRAFIFLS